LIGNIARAGFSNGVPVSARRLSLTMEDYGSQAAIETPTTPPVGILDMTSSRTTMHKLDEVHGLSPYHCHRGLIAGCAHKNAPDLGLADPVPRSVFGRPSYKRSWARRCRRNGKWDVEGRADGPHLHEWKRENSWLRVNLES